MKMRLYLTLFFVLILSALGREKPNVIYIMADDLGYGDLSCYGQTQFKTPNIDRLAHEGIKFEAHYSGSTVCAPSRCSLMTGLHTGHCCVRGNKEIKPVGQHPLPAETLTVAEVFKQNGYVTSAFGKWGLGSPGSEGDPIHQGFDRFYGYNCQRNAHTFYPKWLYDDLEKVDLDGQTYSHDLIAEQALKWIRENKDKPFFCYLPITIPHAAMHVPEEYTAPFRKQFAKYENTIGRYSGPTVKNPVAAFAGMMVKFDETVGELLDLLKELGIDENTIIMFTSDNGTTHEGRNDPNFHIGGVDATFFSSTAHLRGYKGSVYEGGLRVPLIVRLPHQQHAGRVINTPAWFPDIFPTVCDITSITPPSRLDGTSLWGLLKNNRSIEKRPSPLLWVFPEYGGQMAVRIGDMKVVRRNLKNKRVQPTAWEVYDLANDPSESSDIAKERPDIVNQAVNLLLQQTSDNPVFPMPKPDVGSK